jgi:hypothetical protein
LSNPNRPPFKTLTQDLAELERDDPNVRAVVDKLDREAWRQALKGRVAARREAEVQR